MSPRISPSSTASERPATAATPPKCLVSPELGLLLQTGLVISMVVIGGMGTLTGPIVGALLVYLSSEWLRGVGNIQLIVFSLVVIVFARFFRTGLWGLATRRR